MVRSRSIRLRRKPTASLNDDPELAPVSIACSKAISPRWSWPSWLIQSRNWMLNLDGLPTIHYLSLHRCLLTRPKKKCGQTDQDRKYLGLRQGPSPQTSDNCFLSTRDLLGGGRMKRMYIHDKRNGGGKILDEYSISEQASLSVEGYRLVWYHGPRSTTRIAICSHQPLEERCWIGILESCSWRRATIICRGHGSAKKRRFRSRRR